MDLFEAKNNLKKRVVTSLALLLLLYISFINNYILGYILIIVGIFSLLEFFKITKIIFHKKIIFKVIFNSIFFLYVFIFCSLILVQSNYLFTKIIIFILILTCSASDIGGYIFGKVFKGAKLTKISPNKTISGSVGSLVLSNITFLTLVYLLSNNISFKLAIIGLLISISAQVGDLFFSYLKRKSQIKDTGEFLPGHGGVLDRIDGILFGVPVGLITLGLL
tara:strand:+ start:1311 stop:1973 length:663 start_codon:yes stop_codon:yes gene_type:complete